MLLSALSFALGALALAYGGLALYALLRAEARIFPQVPATYEMGPDIQMLSTEDGEQIAVCYLPVEGAATLLLYCHGNGEDIGDRRAIMETYQARGVAVLAVDYPGYGLCSGRASESGCYHAIRAAYRYAIDELGYDPQQISPYGRSLGGGPACWLAANEPVGCLILEGTFTSTFRILTQRKLLPWDIFDNLAKLPGIDCPVLLLHGTADQTVPFSHALKNYAAVRTEKERLWVDGAGHNDLIEVAGEDYWQTVLNFLTKHNKRSTE